MKLIDHSYSADSMKEVCDLFGAVKLEDAYATLTENEEAVLFFPNFNPKAKTGWYNVRLGNGDITESNSNPGIQAAHMKMHVDDQPFDQIRLIFGKIDGKFRFLGVFQLDKAESRNLGYLYWRRLSEVHLLFEKAYLNKRAIQARFVPLDDRISQHKSIL